MYNTLIALLGPASSGAPHSSHGPTAENRGASITLGLGPPTYHRVPQIMLPFSSVRYRLGPPLDAVSPTWAVPLGSNRLRRGPSMTARPTKRSDNAPRNWHPEDCCELALAMKTSPLLATWQTEVERPMCAHALAVDRSTI